MRIISVSILAIGIVAAIAHNQKVIASGDPIPRCPYKTCTLK